MEETGRDIVRFLQAVQAARHNMHAVRNHYVRRELTVHWGQNAFGPTWTDGTLELGLGVTGADGRNYELDVRLRLPGVAWIVEGEISVEQETDQGWAYPTLRELPTRRSDGWENAVADLAAAVLDLTTFADLIPVRGTGP